jgi:hypothetical protein
MYAIARNTWKYQDRDKRVDKIQNIEYEFLAPDTINELFDSLVFIEKAIGKAFLLKEELLTPATTDEELIAIGKKLLDEHNPVVHQLEVMAEGFENSKRQTVIIKAPKAYYLFKELITYYGSCQLINFIKTHSFKTLEDVIHVLSGKLKRKQWVNIGGQLLLKDEVEQFKQHVKEGKIQGWDGVHHWYAEKGTHYTEQKLKHALASLAEIKNINLKQIDAAYLNDLIDEAIATKEWITNSIFESRAKDYDNPYRAMVYENEAEMESVVGRLEDNTFINQQIAELAGFKNEMSELKKRYRLEMATL